MKIKSLFQLVFVLRLAIVESKRHGANSTSTISAAKALRREAQPPSSSWFPSFSVLQSLANALSSSPTSGSITSATQRRRLSWADRWADGYDNSPVSTQGLSKADPDTSRSGNGGGDFTANNPYSLPVMPTKTRDTTEEGGDKATSSSTTSNAKNDTKTNTTVEVDANTETITPWEYKNKTKHEHDADNSLSSDTNGTMHQHGNNTTSPLLPPEKEQPASWYMSVVIIFLVLAIVLCTITAMRNCRKSNKRQGYEQIESHVV